MKRFLLVLSRTPRSFASVAFSAVLLVVIAGCNGAVASSGERVKLLLTPVATPSQTAPAAATVAPVTYTVKSGDTLWDIANLFGVTLDDIVRANNIADPSSLAEGQVLTVPIRPPTSIPAAGATGTTTTQPGQPGTTETPSNGTQTAGPGVRGTPPIPNPSHTLPPTDATPPQGPPIDEPGENPSAPGPTISPTNIP